MRNIVNTYVDRFRHERKTQIRFATILLVLALVVVGIVFWQLRNTGVAMANDTYCGLEEHTHSEDCYETVLTCGLEEGETAHTHDESCLTVVQTLTCGLEESAGHSHSDSCYDEDGNLICGMEESAGHAHTDACYTTQNVVTCGLEEGEPHEHDESCYEHVLICDIPEHEHDILCMSDENADVETARDWEATLPDEISDNWAEAVISIAQSQLGYTESEQNFQLAEDGETRQGYTRYGAWYGVPYGDWCAMFVSFCLNYAEIPEETFPEAAGCYAWTVELEKMDLYADAEDYEPVPGDIIFFDLDEEPDGKADHVGIVEEVITKTVNGEEVVTKIKTIEGNSNDKVQERTYKIDDETILGYGILPENPEEDEDTEDAAETEELITYAAGTQSGVTVQAEVPEGALPEGAQLHVTVFDEDSAEYAEAAETIGMGIQTFSADEPETGLAVLDISFLVDGEEVEPTEPVTVTMDVTALVPEDAGSIVVQHLVETENGVEPEVVAEISAEDPIAEFEVESFSVFTVEWNDGTDTTVEVHVYNMNGTSINETLDEASNLIASGGTIAISELVAHLESHSGLANEYTYQYATVIYETSLGGPGYSSDTIGNRENSVVSISKSETTYTVTLTGGTQTVADPALIKINLYYSTPTIALSAEEPYGETISFTVTSEYFQHEDVNSSTTYTWSISDRNTGALTPGENGTALFAWDTGTAQAGDQVTVTVTKTVTYTDSEGNEQKETASDTYTLTYGEDPVTFTVTLNGTPQANAHVAIVDENGNTISTGTTNENGQVTLYTIDGGTYTVGVTYCVADTSGMGGGSTSRYTAEGIITLSNDGTVVTGDTTIALGTTVIVSGPNGNTNGMSAGGDGPYYYEHIDVKVAAAGTEETQVSFSDLDAVYVYDKYGNLLYVSEDLERNPETGDYNCLFDINGSEDQHSIVVSSEDTIVIVYEVVDSYGNYSTYTATYTSGGTYPTGEYYSYADVNAYQLYNYKYSAAISEEDWEEALESDTLSTLLGEYFNENGIDIGGMGYTVVADCLCDTRTTAGQAGLDFVIAVQEMDEMIQSWNFAIAKTYENVPAEIVESSSFGFTLSEATVSSDIWTVAAAEEDVLRAETGDWSKNSDGSYSSTAQFESQIFETSDTTMIMYYVLHEDPSEDAEAKNPYYGIQVTVTFTNGISSVTVSYYELTPVDETKGSYTATGEAEPLTAENEVFYLPFTNTYTGDQSYPVDIYKYTTGETNEGEEESAEPDRNPLSGAEFTLSYTETNGEGVSTTYYARFTYEQANDENEGSQDTYTFMEWVAEDELSGETVYTLTSGSDGYIHIENLSAGTYTLTETKAPDGYNLLSEPIVFTVGAGGTLTSETNGVVIPVNGNDVVGVENISSAKLPNTGGIGTAWFYIIGSLLICGAIVIHIARRRRDANA